MRCREITSSDLEGVIDLLTLGFKRTQSYWRNVITILSERFVPPGLPRFGYVLESHGSLAGALLMIFSERTTAGATTVRGNGCSLYVQPRFRSYAPLLIKHAESQKNVTYLNLTPARHTWPILEAQGHRRFANGRYVSIPIIGRSQSANLQIWEATPQACRDRRLEAFESDLLTVHATYGCICLLCESENTLRPFVFRPKRRRGVPIAHLIYCRDQNDLVWASASLGRYLATRGLPLVVTEANSPIAGLPGKYLETGPRYWKGTEPPRLGDLAYTEIAMFGV